MRNEGQDGASQFRRRARGHDHAVTGFAMGTEHFKRHRQQALADFVLVGGHVPVSYTHLDVYKRQS